MPKSRTTTVIPRLDPLVFSWITICILIAIVIIPGLHLWPKIAQDESQILDFSRVFLNPSTDWSMGWRMDDNSPYRPNFYLGLVFQDLIYKAFSPSNFGPRLSSFVGALLAVSLYARWLILRSTPKKIALVISIALLLDPIFNDSYRQARIDSWGFFTVFYACLLLRQSLISSAGNSSQNLKYFSAGCFTTASIFIWPTTVVLFPLILLEFYAAIKSKREAAEKVGGIVKFFVLGGLVSAAVLMTPLILHWEQFLASFRNMIGIQSEASITQHSIVGMIAVYSPFAIPTLLAALIVRLQPGLLIGMTIAVVLMLQTMIYPMRILYLLPYLGHIIAGAFEKANSRPEIRWRHAILFCLTCLLLIWNIKVSLIDRPVLSHFQAKSRSPNQIQTGLANAIGQGDYRIYVVEWDMYFAARANQWKLFKLLGRHSQDKNNLDEFLQTMDYVLIRDKYLYRKEVSPTTLESIGFSYLTAIQFSQPEQHEIQLGPLTIVGPKKIYEDIEIYKYVGLNE